MFGSCVIYDEPRQLWYKGHFANGFFYWRGTEYDEFGSVIFDGFYDKGTKLENIVPLEEMNGYWKEYNSEHKLVIGKNTTLNTNWLALVSEMILEEKKEFAIFMIKKRKSIESVNGKKTKKSPLRFIVKFTTSLENYGVRDILIIESEYLSFQWMKRNNTGKNMAKTTN